MKSSTRDEEEDVLNGQSDNEAIKKYQKTVQTLLTDFLYFSGHAFYSNHGIKMKKDQRIFYQFTSRL